MIISACILGNTEVSAEIVSKFKALSYYKKRDSDTEGIRIHVSYVDDPDLLNSDITFRYELANGNFANALNDGTQRTKKESTISNDKQWLLLSDGHDTVIEASEDPEKYLDILIDLIKKGYDVYITSRVYADKYWKYLEDASSGSGATITYCDNIPSLFGLLDEKYRNKLALQRKNLVEDSYNATPCGFSALS